MQACVRGRWGVALWAGVAAGGGAVGAAGVEPALAQDARTARTWFPDVRYFENPVADVREPRMSAGLIGTDLFEAPSTERPPVEFPPWDRPEFEVQGTVGFGMSFPVWRPAHWDGGGVVLGLQAGVLGRFRIERPSRDHVGTDWVVALPVEMAGPRVSGRLRLLHRSAHLGDELAQQTGARRIEYSHEAVDGLLAYRVGSGVRVYGGGTVIFRSNTEQETVLEEFGRRDRAVLQAGAEGEWRGWSDGRLGLIAGLDWQRAERTDWRDEFSVAAGVGARAGAHGFRLLARYRSGPSALGEFFLTPEAFWGIEFVADI